MTLAPISGPDGTVLFDEPALPNAVDHPHATQRADLDALDLGALVSTILTADPTIATLTPSTVAASAGAVTVTVSGSNYVAGSVVEVDQVAKATTFVNATTLTISFDPTVAGTVQFTVRNPNEEESNDVAFTVTAAADDEPDEEPTSFDPHGHNIDDVKAYINGLPNNGHLSRETQRVLNLERQGQNRVTLIEWLDAKMGAV